MAATTLWRYVVQGSAVQPKRLFWGTYSNRFITTTSKTARAYGNNPTGLWSQRPEQQLAICSWQTWPLTNVASASKQVQLFLSFFFCFQRLKIVTTPHLRRHQLRPNEDMQRTVLTENEFYASPEDIRLKSYLESNIEDGHNVLNHSCDINKGINLSIQNKGNNYMWGLSWQLSLLFHCRLDKHLLLSMQQSYETGFFF